MFVTMLFKYRRSCLHKARGQVMEMLIGGAHGCDATSAAWAVQIVHRSRSTMGIVVSAGSSIVASAASGCFGVERKVAGRIEGLTGLAGAWQIGDEAAVREQPRRFPAIIHR